MILGTHFQHANFSAKNEKYCRTYLFEQFKNQSIRYEQAWHLGKYWEQQEKQLESKSERMDNFSEGWEDLWQIVRCFTFRPTPWVAWGEPEGSGIQGAREGAQTQ